MSNLQQPGKKKSTLDEWLSRKKKTVVKKGISPLPEGKPAVLSHGQERLWLLDQIHSEKALYNYAHHYRFNGAVNIDYFVLAFQQLAQRQQVMLSNYELLDEHAIQKIAQTELAVEKTDLSDLSPEQQEAHLADQRASLVSKPFDLAHEALLRLHIFKLSESAYEVILVLHHIMGDAWSMGIINQELAVIYQALSTDSEPALPHLSIQYKDYAYWQRQQAVKADDLAYWKNKLAGNLPVFNLPKQAESHDDASGNTYRKQLDASLSQSLHELAKKQTTTMYVVMLAAYKLLVSRYSQQSDVIVGSPFSNRDLPELEKLVGFFNETLVLRTTIDSHSTFKDLVTRVKQTTLDALSHKNVPFDTLVNEIKPTRQAGENPLFQTMFLYNPAPLKLDLGTDITIEEALLDLNHSKFDLTLLVNEVGDGLELAFEYDTRIDPWFVTSMASHLEALLTSIVEQPEIAISHLSIYSKEMQVALNHQWQGPAIKAPEYQNIQELIFSHTEHENKKAVTLGDASLTYKELDEWSDQLARQLRAQGVERNHFVGLLTPRSLEMVAGILGILKAGGAYLPLDPDYPQDRIDFMLADSGAEVVLHHPDLTDQLPLEDKKAVAISFDQDATVQSPVELINISEDYAYIIYTSGSTGKPKGVPVTHANLLHSTTARFEFFEDPLKRFLLLSSFSFDSSIVGIFWSLCAGGTLVLPPKRIEQDIEGLTDIIAQQQVSHTLMLPSLYQVLLNFANTDKLSSLTAVIVAGEACSQALKSTHFEQLPTTRLYNEYGPTEASVWCVAHEIKSEDQEIPIGRPIANSQAYILDQNLQPVPAGTEGELYIGGPGVTHGYLNRASLTAERFLPDPFEKNKKIYRTGDLGKFRQDGVILFLGRADQQVKIRGFRVEPEEIRNRILEEPNVTEALVKVLEDTAGNKQLVTWVQSTQPDLEVILRKNLKSKLPEYMVPAGIHVMASLPKLPNGKVDGSKLQATATMTTPKADYTAASGKKEEVLTSVWQDVLKIDQIGVEDNFFDIGGDSILSIQIVAKARQAGLDVGSTDIFTHQSIKALAHHVNWHQESTTAAQRPVREYPVTFDLSYQQQAFLLHSLQSESDQGLLQLEFKIKGAVQPQLMQAAWQKVASLHPIMRTSFHWEGLEAPHQVIHEQTKIDWTYLDDSTSIEKFKETDLAKGIDLTHTGGGRLTLVKKAKSDFSLFWTCHHILVDGWSGAIVFKDALQYYELLLQSSDDTLEYVPDYKQFLDWKASKDEFAAADYWRSMLQSKEAPLFTEHIKTKLNTRGFKDLSFQVDTTGTGQLQQKAQEARLTINTLLQGLWMLTLGNYFGETEVSTGLTVTGRSSDFEGINRITGLLMNVLPFQVKIGKSEKLITWFEHLQQQLTALRQFEHNDTDQIQQWTQSENRPYFDNLFVFGNFMSEAIRSGDLEVEEYKGDFSATFPITIRVNPGPQFEFNCRYDAALIPESVVQWLMAQYEQAIRAIIEGEALQQAVSSLLVAPPPPLYIEADSATDTNNVITEFSAAENPTQLSLLNIFEKVLDRQLIDIHDSYFDLGGTSLGAIRLVGEIEKKFGKKVSPTTLINKPTVASLASLISEGEEEAWSSIVPMKASGSQVPLFCLHSGGAHVLFYQGLAKYISADRPVYAIQPSGLDHNQENHSSITEMAADYIAEMRKIQPEGPYHLLGSCFGNAVGIEMSHQLKAMGQELAVLYIIDSAPAFLVPPSPNGERKPVSRAFTMIKEGNWNGIVRKFRNRFIRLDKKISANKRSEQEIELDEIIDSLNDLYATYTWKPIQDNVVLIRSTEFSQRKDKEFHLKRWQHLAEKQLEVCEVAGHHLTLFEEPEVEGLTKVINAHLATLGRQISTESIDIIAD